MGGPVGAGSSGCLGGRVRAALLAERAGLAIRPPGYGARWGCDCTPQGTPPAATRPPSRHH